MGQRAAATRAPAATPPPEARRARAGVDVLFLLNAVAYANVVPRLPALRDDLGLSNTALGAAIAAMPAGALVCGLAAGPIVARHSSARTGRAAGAALGVAVALLAAAPSWAALALAFVALGAADAVMDVAMNTHGLRVQRLYPRSIITSFHALWSVGAVAGGVAGSAVAGGDVALEVHLAVVGGVVALAALATGRLLLPGGDDAPGAPAGLPGEAPAVAPAASTWQGLRGPGLRTLGLLALIVVVSGAIEDSPGSWGAALLRDELGTSAAFGGAVYVVFQAAMTAGRLVGDRALDRWGPVRVVRAGTLAGGAAVGLGLASGQAWATVAGFGVAGLGAATLFPVVYQAAGELPGVRTGHGVAFMAWVGRAGFLVTPPLVGALGDATSLRAALAVVPVACLVAAASAGALAPQPRRGSSGSSSSQR